MQKSFLEDIVEEDYHKIRKEPTSLVHTILPSREFVRVVKVLARHPVVTGVGLYLLAREFGNDIVDFIGIERARMSEHDNKIASILPAYAVYYILGSIKDYAIEKARIGLRKGKDLADRIPNWCLENPKIVSLGAMAGQIGLIWLSSSMMPKDTKISRVDIGTAYFAYVPLTGMLSELLVRNLKTARRIKKATRELKTSYLEKAWNFIFEHPVALGAVVGSSRFFYDYMRIYRPGEENPNRLVRDQGASWFVINADVALIVGLAAAYGITFAGSFLHGHSLRNIRYKFSVVYNKFREKYDEAIRSQERINSLPDNIERKVENFVDLGNLHYEKGDKEEAFKCYRRAVRLINKKSDTISYFEFFRKTFSIDKVARYFKRSRGNEVSSIVIDLLNKDVKTIERLKRLVETNLEDYKLRYIYGKALDIIGFNASGREQKLQAVSMAIESGVGIKYLKGSKRTLFLFDDGFLGDEVIANEDENILRLEEEKNLTEIIAGIIKDFDNREVPVPIGIKEVNGKVWYIMERASGKTLKEKVETGKASLDDFLEVADFMALIHANLNPELAKPERNYADTISSRLTEFGVDAKLVSVIHENIKPVIDNFRDVTRVYSQDPHFDNWIMLDYGGIIKIDLEAGMLVPLTYDAASLTCYHRFLSEEEAEQVTEVHRKSFVMLKRDDVDRNTYRLAYLSSVIVQAFEIYSRKFRSKDVKISLLRNARDSINMIERNFNDNFRRHESSYRLLNFAIDQLSLTLLD